MGGKKSYIYYKAPEIYSKGKQYLKTDVWNLGLVVFVMFSGYFFEDKKNEPGDCEETLVKSLIKQELKDVDNVFINFVLSCTAFDLNKRWDSKTALKNALQIKEMQKRKEEEKKKEEDMREQGSDANVLVLKKDLEKLEMMKKNAIIKEDYDSAKSLKKQIEKKKEELRIATQKTTSQGSDANVVVLKKDLEKLEMMKKNAIMKEDYDSAKSLKKQIEKKKEELRIATQ